MPFSLQGSYEFYPDKPCSSCYKNIHNMYLYAVCLLLFYHSNMNPINYISVKFVIHSWTFVLSFKHELPGISHELDHKFISVKFVFLTPSAGRAISLLRLPTSSGRGLRWRERRVASVSRRGPRRSCMGRCSERSCHTPREDRWRISQKTLIASQKLLI